MEPAKALGTRCLENTLRESQASKSRREAPDQSTELVQLLSGCFEDSVHLDTRAFFITNLAGLITTSAVKGQSLIKTTRHGLPLLAL